MQAIILIHGIMGAKLNLGHEEVWPPSLFEIAQGHYKRIAKLRNPGVVATDILYQYTSLYQIYYPIIKELDAIVDAQGGLRPKFFFDWRRDLAESAELLAQTIEDACSGDNPATSVALVAHSMGGLVTRHLLESGKYDNKSWFGNIDRFVSVCVPHIGAPIAVARALGLEGSTTISPADMKILTSDPNYPTAYELFPAPPYRNTVLFDADKPCDIYATDTAAKFQLSAPNQAAALKSWAQFDFASRPSHVSYISIAANGLSTESSFYFDNKNLVAINTEDGDGTVPYRSASAGPVDKLYTLQGDHIAVMNTTPFRQTLWKIFGASMAIKPYIMDRPGVSISLNKRDFKAEEKMEVLLVPDARTTGLSGKLHIKAVSVGSDGAQAHVPTGADVAVTYEGPPIASLPLAITAPQMSGAYVMTFEGTHGSSEETSATFVVRPQFVPAPVRTKTPKGAKTKAKKTSPRPTKARKR